jgi:hypothetical protein
MHNWAKGVYEKWDINKGFPNRNEILRAGARAGATVIRYVYITFYKSLSKAYFCFYFILYHFILLFFKFVFFVVKGR